MNNFQFPDEIHPKMTRTYVGCDSHKDSHTFVFLNCFHDKLGVITVGSAPSEFPKFIKQAKKYLQVGTTFAFGFEDVSAYGRSFVKYLVDRGYLVKHVDSSKVATARGQVLHKTDLFDAECCARVLIDRFDELPNANPQDKYWVLSTLVTRHNAVVKMNTMTKNTLHHLLAQNYPHYKDFFGKITVKSGLVFYEKYPAPHLLENVTVEELNEMLKSATRRNELERAKLILETVKRDNVQPSEYQEQRDYTVRSLVRQVQNNLLELDGITAHIETILNDFQYPLASMKGIDVMTEARLISEIGDINRFKNANALAKYAGVAPVVFASGMTKLEMANARGNRKLNGLIHQVALSTITPRGKNKTVNNPIFYNYYQKKLSQGKTKTQALKCVQRRLINIIYAIMKHKRPYENTENGNVITENDRLKAI